MFSKRLRRPLNAVKRRLYAFVGIPIPEDYRKALNHLDTKLEKYVNYNKGFFVEAGANDGISQSNTYYFEKVRGWRGILVEGIPSLYERCKKNREKSIVFNCALVSDSYHGQFITMHYANLMSVVQGARASFEGDNEYIKTALEIQKLENTYSAKVPVRTLTSIFDQCGVGKIDLFSLDVEGYELDVLKGLAFNRYRPKYMCIEAWNRKEIEDYILPYYDVIEDLTERDILYKAK